MKYLKLIKLLYLADREALSRWGRPITTDNYVSMDNGPVLSQILKRIDDGAAPGEPTFWTSHIVPCGDWDVMLTADPSDGQLSTAEDRLLDQIFEQYGHRNRWDLVNYVHTLPEWQDPSGRSLTATFSSCGSPMRRSAPLRPSWNISIKSKPSWSQGDQVTAGGPSIQCGDTFLLPKKSSATDSRMTNGCSPGATTILVSESGLRLVTFTQTASQVYGSGSVIIIHRCSNLVARASSPAPSTGLAGRLCSHPGPSNQDPAPSTRNPPQPPPPGHSPHHRRIL